MIFVCFLLSPRRKPVFSYAVYVLHCFQKKTEATTKHDKDIAQTRYRSVLHARKEAK